MGGLIMRQFNLTEYLENPELKVVTRDGKPARIVCTDAKGRYPVVALVYNEKDNREVSHFYRENGCYLEGGINHKDLFFETTKHTGWINIYRVNDARTGTTFEPGAIFKTKEEALKYKHLRCCINGISYLNTIYIEWED